MSTSEKTFDASRYLTKLKGRDYLEVKWRLLWLRTEHPGADIATELVHFTPELAIVKATVRIAEYEGSASAHAMQAPTDFNEWLEKAETKAVGRALAMLGYGTQFATELDWERDDNGQVAHIADAPVERPAPAASPPQAGTPRPATTEPRAAPTEAPATPAQVKAIYSIARAQHGLSEAEVDERCQQEYGTVPAQLGKRQASQFIDALQKVK